MAITLELNNLRVKQHSIGECDNSAVDGRSTTTSKAAKVIGEIVIIISVLRQYIFVRLSVVRSNFVQLVWVLGECHFFMFLSEFPISSPEYNYVAIISMLNLNSLARGWISRLQPSHTHTYKQKRNTHSSYFYNEPPDKAVPCKRKTPRQADRERERGR